MDQNEIQNHLEICHNVYKLYSTILNSYVSDYYLEDHWNKLSPTWKDCFDHIEINQLSNILNLTKPLSGAQVYPLSLLCLRSITVSHTLSRKIIPCSATCFENKFMNFFWKNIKLKKRHEIEKMAKLCYDSAQKTNCFYIVDIGSGVGHLSRMLSYGFGLKVCTFEAVEALTDLAKKMDTNFEEALTKRNIKHKATFKTIHVNQKITKDLIKTKFLELVVKAFNNVKNVKFGLVGLHPCGDLSALLLKLYTDCSNIVFINIASCCYMKITLKPIEEAYFPLSRFCKSKKIILSYLDCEIACHAIENYSEKLRISEEYQKLKIHAYRAAIEAILVTANSELKHSMICGAKCDKNFTFRDYVEKVGYKLHNVTDEKISLYENIINKTWNKVVAFYSIRLLLAPLVENIILLDRWLFVLESGSCCKILPLFDCNISPRNQVLSSFKIKN